VSCSLGREPQGLGDSPRKAPAGRRRYTRHVRGRPAQGARHRPAGAREVARIGPLGLAPQAIRRRHFAAGCATCQTCVRMAGERVPRESVKNRSFGLRPKAALGPTQTDEGVGAPDPRPDGGGD